MRPGTAVGPTAARVLDPCGRAGSQGYTDLLSACAELLADRPLCRSIGGAVAQRYNRRGISSRLQESLEEGLVEARTRP